MARQRLRLVTVRKPGSFDDQKASATIAASETAAADEQEFIENVLSQIRQILGTANWYDPPTVTIADLATREVCNEIPSGLKNNANQVFTTANFFIPDSEKVYVNGMRMSRKGGFCDYEISESGGVGTGYDTITLGLIAPDPDEQIMVDYTKSA